MQKINKTFLYITLGCLLIWSLVPLLRQSLPMDTQEAVMWGKYCLWGTTKHPPLSGWLAYGFYRLFGRLDGSMYLLSQLCVVAGVIYIYKLAKCFMSPTKAGLAALLQYGIIYYHFSAVEYNVNVVSLALWPICAYYFWRAYRENLWRDWLLFGIFAAANLLNKYVSAVLFLSLALFVLADKGFLKMLRNVKTYVAVLLCIALIFPHLYWLWQHDFEPFNYIAGRSSGGKIGAPWNHFIYPLKFLFAQLLFAAAAIITYGIFYAKYRLVKSSGKGIKSWLNQVCYLECGKERTYSLFILLNAVAPTLIFMCIALISGHPLKSMWGYPALYMLGIALFYFLPIQWNKKAEKRYLIFISIWILLFATGYAIQCCLTKSEKFNLDNRRLVAELEQKWQQHNPQKPLEYVVADVWFADMLAFYANGNVKPMVWGKTESNPWFKAEDFAQKGAMVIAASPEEYAEYENRFGSDITPPQQLDYTVKNYLGKTKDRNLYYGFYQKKDLANAKKP